MDDALVGAGLRTFQGIGSLVTLAERQIAESRASIIILSEEYADSTPCLDELVFILEQRRKSNHFVLPLFYGVQSSDVMECQNRFALQGIQASGESMEKMDQWMAALTEVATLPGINVSKNHELTVIGEIVRTVRNALYPNPGGTSSSPQIRTHSN